MPVLASELLGRIGAEYRFVRVSEGGGAEFVAARIDELDTNSARQREVWLALLPSAVEVIATDDLASDTAFLKLFLFDGRRPIVKFFTEDHEEDSDGLLDRLLVLLGPIKPEIWPFEDPRPISRPPRPGVRRL